MLFSVLAAEPTNDNKELVIEGPIVGVDGYITAKTMYKVPTSELSVRLQDFSEQISPHLGVSSISTVDLDNGCQQVSVFTAGASGATLATVTKRCLINRVWEDLLVSSDVYDEFHSTFQLASIDSGSSSATYRVKVKIKGVAPIIINYHTGEKMAANLRWVGTPAN